MEVTMVSLLQPIRPGQTACGKASTGTSLGTVTTVDNLGLTDAQRTNVDQTITTIEAYVQGTDQRDGGKVQLSSKSTTGRYLMIFLCLYMN